MRLQVLLLQGHENTLGRPRRTCRTRIRRHISPFQVELIIQDGSHGTKGERDITPRRVQTRVPVGVTSTQSRGLELAGLTLRPPLTCFFLPLLRSPATLAGSLLFPDWHGTVCRRGRAVEVASHYESSTYVCVVSSDRIADIAKNTQDRCTLKLLGCAGMCCAVVCCAPSEHPFVGSSAHDSSLRWG